MDPVELLARDDKWQLGAGEGTLYAPEFPRWLDAPGFWDGGEIADGAVAPLFTVTALDDDGAELEPRATARRWTPAELTLQYRLGQGITATEVRTVHPGGIFVSEWRFAAYKPCRIHLVAWTAHDAAQIERRSAAWNGALGFTIVPAANDARGAALHAELACVGGAESWGIARSAGELRAPAWKYSPFVELWRGAALPRNAADDAPPRAGGVFFAAVHRVLDIEYAGASATFAMRVVRPRPAALPIPAGARQATFSGASRRRWSEYFAGCPGFRCSDPYFESIWWYRWYLLRLRAGANAAGRVRELAWRGDAEGVRDALQRAVAFDADDIAVADALFADDALIHALYPRLVAAAESLLAVGDAGSTDMFDLSVDDPSLAVRGGEARAGSLKGVDSTARAYSLFRLLAQLAGRAGAGDGAARWMALAERTRSAIREKMWNKKTKAFSDVNATSLKMTNVKSAQLFLAYATDIADATHVAGLEKHLLNPAEFFTSYPVPSLSVDDARFSAEGEWQGVRATDPWNGRSHPALTGAVIDALVRVARAHAPQLLPHAATLIRRCVRMMFEGGDLNRVNSRAHYNPLTGHGAEYAGLEDIAQGAVNDMIVRHVMGVGVTAEAITIDPIPCGLEYAEVTGLMIRGRPVDVLIEQEAVTVTVGGAKTIGTIGTVLTFPTAS